MIIIMIIIIIIMIMIMIMIIIIIIIKYNENNEKVSKSANVTEIQKICMLGSARNLRKVLSICTERLTWVTDDLGAWFAPR